MTVSTIRPPAKGGNNLSVREVENITGLAPVDGLLADMLLADDPAERETLATEVATLVGRASADGKPVVSQHAIAVAAARARVPWRAGYADELYDLSADALRKRRDERSAQAIDRVKASIEFCKASNPGNSAALKHCLEYGVEDDLGRFSDAHCEIEIPSLVAYAGIVDDRAEALICHLQTLGRIGRDDRETQARLAYRAAFADRAALRQDRKRSGLSSFDTYTINPATGRVVADEEFEAAEIARAEAEHVEAVISDAAKMLEDATLKGTTPGSIAMIVFEAACLTRNHAVDGERMIAKFVGAAGNADLGPLFERTVAAAWDCAGPAETEAAFTRLLEVEDIAAPFAFARDGQTVPVEARRAIEAPSAAVEAPLPPAAISGDETADVALPAMQVDKSVDPFDIATLPGILGDTANWMSESAYRPIPEFAVMSALAFCATLFGRKYETPTGIGVNLYLIGLAGASFGKEDLVGLPQKLLLETGNHHLLGPGDVTSDSSIETTLRDRPCFLMAMDEIGVFLQGMNGRNAGGWEKRIRKIFLELYSKSHQTWTGKQRASSDRINAAEPLFCPTMNILGAAVEDGFYAGMDEQNLSDGMFARLTVIKASGRPSRNSRRGKVVVPQHLKDAVKHALRDRYQGGGDLASANHRNSFITPDLRSVEWASDEVRDQWEQIEERQDDAIERDSSLKGILGRAAAQTLKLASIRAIARNPGAPQIQADDIAWGYALVSRSIDTIQSGVADHMAGSDFEVLCKTIHRIAREAHPKSIAMSDLVRKKGVSKAEPRIVRSALERLVEQRYIYDPKIGSGNGGGRGMRVTARFE